MKHHRMKLFIFLGALTLGLLFGNGASAQIPLENIRVEGNQRIEAETVKSYLTVDAQGMFDPAKSREAIQKLFDTGFFKDVVLEEENGVLVVRVVENAMVNKVTFEGNDSFGDEELEKLIQLKGRSIYDRAKGERDLAALRQAYRVKGLFLAKVEMLIKPLDQNQINLVYRIKEGEASTVHEVRIIGNQAIDDSELTDKLMIQSTNWLSWIRDDNTYDREKLLYDQSQLRSKYLNSGYIRVKVSTSVAEMTADRKAFIVTHTVSEGDRYKFGTVEVVSDVDARELTNEQLNKQLTMETGEWYSRQMVRDSIENLSDLVGDLGYGFLDVAPGTRIDDEKKVVNVTLRVRKGRRVYLNRIKISGNTRTEDEVIRREMQLVEGDRFSSTKIKRSQDRITGLNFFENVSIKTFPTSDRPDAMDVDVKVEEKPTGSFTVGAGYSTTDKLMGTASVSQNNFLGKGQKLVLSFTLSSSSNQFNISFTEPYFLGRNVSLGFDLFNEETDTTDYSTYHQSKYGGALRLGFPISREMRNYVSYNFANVEIDKVSANASSFVQDQARRSPYIQSMVSNTLVWNSLDNNMMPSKGRKHRLTGDFSGVGGDVTFVRLMTDNSYYKKLLKKTDLIGHLRGKGGYIDGIDEEVPIFERFFLGGTRSIRGFKNGGVGPRTSGGEAFGGTYYGHANAEVFFPMLGLADKGVRGITFLDAGFVGDLDNLPGDVQSDDIPRISAGFGVLWNSPFGPLRFSLGFPIQKSEFDKVQVFDFSIGSVM
ncbi:MAG: outer membrane protein assembly factor BamA [Magnetococcales bacterium]|nr:outer membrane protein assembly factor BamA [Magnetococcales bacterium]